jgi:hypothetical protein
MGSLTRRGQPTVIRLSIHIHNASVAGNAGAQSGVSGARVASERDACQTAWSTLLGRRDIDLDQRGLNWLTTIATRQAWRQGSAAREQPAGAFIAAGADLGAGAGELPEPAGPAGDPADLALARDEHNQRVAWARWAA